MEAAGGRIGHGERNDCARQRRLCLGTGLFGATDSFVEVVDVFVLEYPGYGARSGTPSRASIMAAAEEAFQLLPPRQNIW